jgi:hypothetical protein
MGKSTLITLLARVLTVIGVLTVTRVITVIGFYRLGVHRFPSPAMTQSN